MAEKKSDDDILAEAREKFGRAMDAENHNRETFLEDIRFAKLGEQWPDEIETMRRKQSRPCLTINKMPTFIRQVVNDSRQNKPSIKVRPVDSGADRDTADVINGLIRNIEYTSNADVAYDTAIESAVAGGFGYIRVGLDYAYDDSFDMDITIERVLNPLCVYGDPNSMSADGSDWDVAFITERMPKDTFKAKYKGKALVDFEHDAWSEAGDDWLNEDGVLVAEYWTREEVVNRLFKLNNGAIVDDQKMEDPDIQIALQMGQLQVVGEREAKSYKVRQVIMSGVDVLENNDWPGRYIPIVPVYGDDFAVEGKRYFRSLISAAKDAQRMVNYWRSTSTELVALAPRVPFIGPKGAFKTDSDRWATANTESHSYLEYDGPTPPQRQPLDMGVAAGALQEALNASDDMKAIIGMYDASLGARSNETSGKAIMARQREGDIATFHFIDNLSRAIRHVGRIMIDLIPIVYTGERVVRVIGEDGKENSVEINKPTQKTDDKGRPMVDATGQAVMAMHDLTAGKYDLTVEAGPSFTTRREETAAQITEMIRAFPQAAPILGGPLAKNLDWPGAQEISEKLEKMDPTNQQQGIPPQMQEQIQKFQMEFQKIKAENEQLKADKAIDEYDAQTKRMKVQGDQALDQAELGVNVIEKLMPPEQPDPMRQG